MGFKPFRPLKSYQYRCENNFFTNGLYDLLEVYEKFGFIILYGSDTIFVTLRGNQYLFDS